MFKSKCLTFFISTNYSFKHFTESFFPTSNLQRGKCSVSDFLWLLRVLRAGGSWGEWGEWGDPAPVLMRNDQMRPEPERVQPPLISQQITTFVQNKLWSSTSSFTGGNEPFWEQIFLCFDLKKTDAKQNLCRTKTSLLSIPRIACGIGFVSCLTSP